MQVALTRMLLRSVGIDPLKLLPTTNGYFATTAISFLALCATTWGIGAIQCVVPFYAGQSTGPWAWSNRPPY